MLSRHARTYNSSFQAGLSCVVVFQELHFSFGTAHLNPHTSRQFACLISNIRGLVSPDRVYMGNKFTNAGKSSANLRYLDRAAMSPNHLAMGLKKTQVRYNSTAILLNTRHPTNHNKLKVPERAGLEKFQPTQYDILRLSLIRDRGMKPHVTHGSLSGCGR